MAGYEDIKITHLINPHLFWYRVHDTDGDRKIKIYENKLGKYVKNYRDIDLKWCPGDGDAVAVLHESKWIRATVERALSSHLVIVWAMDYGHPLTVPKKSMMAMENHGWHVKDAVNIYKGGLADCRPAKTVEQKGERKLQKQRVWSAKAVKQFQAILSTASTVHFKVTKTHGDHSFGELMYSNEAENQKFSVADALVSGGVTLRSSGLDYSKLSTIRFERWQSNCDVAQACSDDQAAQYRLPRANKNARKWSADALQIKFHESPIFIYGKHVKPLQNNEEIPFSRRVKKHLTREHWLNSLHMSAWPHLMCGYSLVVSDVGVKTNIYLPTLCTMVTQFDRNNAQPDGDIEALILCASVEAAAAIMESCQKFLKIRQDNNKVLFLQPDTKPNLLKGCTVLISTPKTMMSLMRDGNGNILEFRSLKHFVVDEFGDVASKFNVDLLALVRIQLHIGSKDCQTIVTTSVWSDVLTYMIKRMHRSMVAVNADASLTAFDMVQGTMGSVSTSTPFATIASMVSKRPTEQTAVICQAVEQAHALAETLREQSIDFTLMLNDEKQINNAPVLIATQSALRFKPIDDATHLIHLTPPRTIQLFIRNHCISFEAYRKYLKKSGPRPTSILVLSSVSMVKGIVPMQILIDNKKRNYKDLCYNWIIYGQLCPGECVFRHHLNESDIPRNRYPSGTEIRYRINHIYSPVHLQISEVDDVDRAPKKTLRLIIGGLVPIDEPERYILFRRHLFRNHNLGSIFKSIVRLHLNGVILVDDVIAVDTATSSASMPLSEILSRADFVEANFDGISTLIQELNKLQQRNHRTDDKRPNRRRIRGRFANSTR